MFTSQDGIPSSRPTVLYLKKNRGGAIVHSLCAFIVRLHCALRCALSSFVYCALCVKPLCAHCAQSLRAQVVHNGKPPSLHNEAAQCKSIVRSAWHNGRAYIGEAKSAWHNDFVIVRFFFRYIFFKIKHSIYIYIYIYICTHQL